MSIDPSQKGINRKEFNRSLVLGAVIGQVGCLTILIILAALFGGLWLDKTFGTKPIITFGLVVASVPVTLFLIVWIVRKSVAKLQGNPGANDHAVGQGGDQQ